MSNPMFSNRTSPNGATNPENPLSGSYKRYHQGYNRYDLSRTFYNTERYADINVVDVIDAVEGDKISFGVKQNIRAYTWKAPKMFDIHKRLSYFMVDRKAILPNHWEKVYKQPNKGDDVDVRVNSVSTQLFYSVFDIIAQIANIDYREIPSTFFDSKKRICFVLFLESVFSNGSLPASMNAHLSSMIAASLENSPVDISNSTSFDYWLESFYDNIISKLWIRSSSFNTIFTTSDAYGTGITVVSPQFLADYVRSYDDWEIVGWADDYQAEAESNSYSLHEEIFLHLMQLHDPNHRGGSPDYTSEEYYFNFSRLIAYQLICGQFYTRDSVDDIYTAELWMQNQNALGNTIYKTLGSPFPSFTYNGTTQYYDACSGYIFDINLTTFIQSCFSTDTSTLTDQKLFNASFGYLRNIFFFQKSLRYGDYFNSSKTLPLAPLDVTADVVGNSVSAIDMTRSIIAQRFANAVERVSNTMKDYVKDLMGGNIPPNPLEPRFLSSTVSSVDGFEVENTTNQDQGNIVTVLKSSDSKYIYSVDVGSPAIIIGVSTYSVPIVYTETTERFWNHYDRFTMFNKFFQNIGDQEITCFERSSRMSPDSAFGYTPRHMEYKQRYNFASGGFINSLPGYSFTSDLIDNSHNNDNYFASRLVPYHIGPEYIRNHNYELDRFYSSLTGLSLSNYFHFILCYRLQVDSKRQMEYSPTIL